MRSTNLERSAEIAAAGREYLPEVCLCTGEAMWTDAFSLRVIGLATGYHQARFDRARGCLTRDKPMLYSIVTPIAVLLLALGASYAITRPIGDGRRHILALLVSLALGVVGAVAVGAFHEAAYDTAFLVTLVAAIVGATMGMVLAWRRRNPLEQPQTQSKTRRQSSRRPHYGISRA
jgi:hypothetical protein